MKIDSFNPPHYKSFSEKKISNADKLKSFKAFQPEDKNIFEIVELDKVFIKMFEDIATEMVTV